MIPYYEDSANGITIYHADALSLLRHWQLIDDPPDITLAVADPPYNCGIDYGNETNDGRDPHDYERWCGRWFSMLARAHRIVVFPGHGNLPHWFQTTPTPSLVGCWYKPGNPAGGAPVQFCEWEPWLYWGPYIGGSDTIRATISKQRGVGDHPCPKPLRLYHALIKRMTKPGDLVLDPFMGSGTTLRAAKDLGRQAIGVELEERYCELAALRLGQEVLPLEADA